MSGNRASGTRISGIFRAAFKKGGKFVKYLKKHGLSATVYKLKRLKNQNKHYAAISSTISPEQRSAEESATFSRDITFSVLVPLYNTPIDFLNEMIDSLIVQTYGKWELCLADGSDEAHSEVGEICRERSARDGRIKYQRLDANRGISINTNACIDMAGGDFIALFDHDDVLHPSALYEMMSAICTSDADFVYTDEAVFESPDINRVYSVNYKPDFAPDNLRANNYICHFSAFSRELLDKSGKFRHEFDGSQDHDMILRLTACAEKIVHIPKVLYFWRSHSASVAQDISTKTYAIDAGICAVKDSLASAGLAGEVYSSEMFPTIYRIKYDIRNSGKVSIIVFGSFSEKQLLKSIVSIEEQTAYKNYEIILCINDDNIAAQNAARTLAQENRVKLFISSAKAPKMLNDAAMSANGEYLLFFSGGIVRDAGWLEELLMYAQREDVAIAAGAVLYRDGKLHHGGYIVDNGRAKRMLYREPLSSTVAIGRLGYSQNLSAVGNEMMMIERELFLSLGKFNEEYIDFYYDIDLCLRAREKNKLVVWTPYAVSYLPVKKSENERNCKVIFTKDEEYFLKTHAGSIEKCDQYYNPNFAVGSSDFSF